MKLRSQLKKIPEKRIRASLVQIALVLNLVFGSYAHAVGEETCTKDAEGLVKTIEALYRSDDLTPRQSGEAGPRVAKMLPTVERANPLWWSPALAVGVWASGSADVDTVALDPGRGSDKVSPTFKEDILKLQSHRTYKTIVFQGCCPVAEAAGLSLCSISRMSPYNKIESDQLASKLSELASPEGCYVYIRNCKEMLDKSKIDDREKRDFFIESFSHHGFRLVPRSAFPIKQGPQSLLPPRGILDNGGGSSAPMWSSEYGALLFYRPPVLPPTP